MSQPLWQKSGVQIDAKIMKFLAGDDVLLDREFFLHDITASKAHVEGLANIGVVSADESLALKHELDALAADFSSGAFVLDDRYEDGHSAIEARLTERLGDAGRRVHTGRSRNDQILVATRLWLKDQLVVLQDHCRAIARVCLDRAAQTPLPLPGYTHLQRAVVSSTSMWFAGFAEGFVDNAWRARQTSEWIDANPLGTAAGYGVNLKLDREHTTQALGFARMQVSPIYAQLSRGKFEMAVLESIG
ncbi:MAG: lyase family protein, partial [Dokdonella sp.]